MGERKHWNWSEVLAKKPGIEGPTATEMAQYVKGYILAMEDVLRDIQELEAEAHVISMALRFKILESVDSARRTLQALEP